MPSKPVAMKQLFYFTCIIVSLFILATIEVHSEEVHTHREQISAETIKYVDTKTWEWITRIGFLIGLGATILGFFGFKGFNYVLTNIVNSKIENGLRDALREENERAKKNNLRFELSELINEADINLDYALKRINLLFEEAKQTGDKDLIGKFLDKMIFLNFKLAQYEVINNLRQEFEKDIKFTVMTWANIAISNMALYEFDKLPTYKNNAISACDNALSQYPHYGTPQAVRLLIQMIDYDSVEDMKEKEEVKQETTKLINTILKAPLETAYWTFEYLVRSKVNKTFEKYVDMLNNVFPELMKKMEDIYTRGG